MAGKQRIRTSTRARDGREAEMRGLSGDAHDEGQKKLDQEWRQAEGRKTANPER